jgi:3-oxoacyl-[acyl-carrier-protein] synthase III
VIQAARHLAVQQKIVIHKTLHLASGFPSGPARVQALLGINEIFADDLPANPAFVAALQPPAD